MVGSQAPSGDAAADFDMPVEVFEAWLAPLADCPADDDDSGNWPDGVTPALSVQAEEFDSLRRLLSATPVADGEDSAALLARLAAVEQLQRSLAWYAGELMVAIDRQRRVEDRAADVTERRVGSTVASEIGLVRHVSPAKASRELGLASVARRELPRTWDALRRGQIPAVVVRSVASATAMLDLDDRLVVDAQLSTDGLDALSERAVDAHARRRAYEADPRAFVAARARAESDRYVAWRPQPDVMMQITALLPMVQGVAVAAALTEAAERARAAGDERTRGQVMADEFVTRLTGQASATAVPVAVNLVIDVATVLAPDGGTLAGSITAPGLAPQPLPGPAALDLIGTALDERPDTTLRRVFREPRTGELVAMESRSRLFPRQFREYIALRDGVCRTPWCGAPIRHTDHIIPAAEGGPTSAANAAGRCERCNHVKQHPGWRETATPDGRLHITTPSGIRT